MIKLSIILEWSNAEQASVTRGLLVLRELQSQWLQLQEELSSPYLRNKSSIFLATIERMPELIIASGKRLSQDTLDAMQKLSAQAFKLSVRDWLNSEYYSLKNNCALESTGDILLFLDSDVLPDQGWLSAILSSFSNPRVQVCLGQTYVSPVGLFGKAFACGWIYSLRTQGKEMVVAPKFFANNVAFLREAFLPCGFPDIGVRTRGAGTETMKSLNARSIVVWQNQCASVAHPPPSSWLHLALRAMARSRDRYMKTGLRRDVVSLGKTLWVVICRYATAVSRIFVQRHEVKARFFEIPLMIAVISAYYILFAVGAVICFVKPSWMASRFRI